MLLGWKSIKGQARESGHERQHITFIIHTNVKAEIPNHAGSLSPTILSMENT